MPALPVSKNNRTLTFAWRHYWLSGRLFGGGDPGLVKGRKVEEDQELASLRGAAEPAQSSSLLGDGWFKGHVRGM